MRHRVCRQFKEWVRVPLRHSVVSAEDHQLVAAARGVGRLLEGRPLPEGGLLGGRSTNLTKTCTCTCSET